MSIVGQTYETLRLSEQLFSFISEGPQGIIVKMVVLESYRDGYNLAFGNLQGEGEIVDSIVSNNEDGVKVFKTVLKCLYDFLESHQGASIYIHPFDEKRKRVYNGFIRRELTVLQKKFEIFGFIEDDIFPYEANKVYDSFKIIHRRYVNDN